MDEFINKERKKEEERKNQRKKKKQRKKLRAHISTSSMVRFGVISLGKY
jgi:hypothetical protein